MTLHQRVSIIAVLAAALASPAQAQVRTSLAIAPGISMDGSDTGVALAGSVAFDIHDRATVEGTVGATDRGPGEMASYAAGSLLLHLLPIGHRAVPYLAVGGGLYHSTFHLDNYFGGMGSTYPAGTVMRPLSGMNGFGMMGGGSQPIGTFYPGQMPGFYAQRMGAMSVPANNMWGMRSFTDPALSLGGGVTVRMTEHLFLRPDARALVVFANGDTYTVGLVTVGLGYRF